MTNNQMQQYVQATDSYLNPNPAAFLPPVNMWMTPAEFASMNLNSSIPNVSIQNSASSQPLTQITTNNGQMTIGNNMTLSNAFNMGSAVLNHTPITGSFSNPNLASVMSGAKSGSPSWLAGIQSKAGNYGLVFFGAALVLGTLLVSQKDNVVKIAALVK